MNDLFVGDFEIEGIVNRIVDGLFCVLVILGVVSVIRCFRGGFVEMVVFGLD